ncbi:TIGR03617 family F420-dependent LLM class oxidoreductase [Streptomyces sp. NPDC051218]|uniref:TIGR03617 family F420-dependent LLM class oxidoreductase n=1 Tax=Streptomyces sp. NPDC051218 TaxID=3365645 RepID=UPI0037B80FE8
MLADLSAHLEATPRQIAASAAAAEEGRYDGFGVPETRHDVFTGLALAAAATDRICLQSEIAVAFARNPMSVAVLANDIQLISGGRFRLGLGSQVKAHIERRFAMPWSRPAARMEEFVVAIRAIWHAWATGERLTFRGEFYQHTLMTDFFSPGPNPHGNPPVILAAVGERMTQVAGRVADGMLCHSFTTPQYVSERTRPTLREARGSLDGFTLGLPALIILGADEKERADAEAAVRAQIAFYGSTPAYRPVLELHGWEDLNDRLNTLSRRQAWSEMADAIDDEVLDAFAVAGTAGEVAHALHSRFGGLVDRVSLYTPYDADPAQLAVTARALRSIC